MEEEEWRSGPPREEDPGGREVVPPSGHPELEVGGVEEGGEGELQRAAVVGVW